MASIDVEKLQAFRNAKVKHGKLIDVVTQLQGLLTAHSDSNIILITGASGVGKTTLSQELDRMCGELFADVLKDVPSAVPAVVVEAYADGDQRHGFKPLYSDLIEKLHEPGLQAKVDHEFIDGRIVMKPQSRVTIRALRKMVETALRERGTRVCVIDEAYHLLRFANESAVMDTLKSLANTTGVKLVLVGSFDLFDLIVEHGQVARRSMVVNFDRYHIDNAADRAEFRQVVLKLQRVWPCEQTPNFAAISDELMEACLGCVGLLKTFMLDAAAMQMSNKGKWEGRFLSMAAKATSLRETIRREIEAGEKKVRDALMGATLWDETALAKLNARMEACHA